ncbi:hypothetical protein ACFQAT_00045 [Undibacterium arcticum]|uniref:hypothetical protein n=1 Tax=Undibacterium arcticum TaxID=1762892 RepID=UPI003623925A
MAISFFNNLEEVKDLSNQAAAAMSATGLMGCDCIKSTKYHIEFELCRLAIQSRCDTASAKEVLNQEL